MSLSLYCLGWIEDGWRLGHQRQATAAPRPTATSKPTATRTLVNTATLGGTVAAFKATYKVDATCGLAGLCFCASDGDTSCDFLVGITPKTGTRVTEVDLLARGNWPLDMTLTWCLQFMPSGATISSTQSGITTSGFYLYQTDLGRVRMQIAPAQLRVDIHIAIIIPHEQKRPINKER